MTFERFFKNEYLPLPLIALMILTRYHHFGDALHLPDASLAIFFFAGFYRSKLLLGFLLALAAVIDYIAITRGGVSSYCVTPAYIFLAPTYSVMWAAGRYCSLRQPFAGSYLAWPVVLGILFAAASLAFFISNGGFYLFSGRFDELNWADYAGRVARYYPMYLKSTLAYGVFGLAVNAVISALRAWQHRRSAA